MANNNGGNGQRMKVVYPEPWYKKILPVLGIGGRTALKFWRAIGLSLVAALLLVSCWQSNVENPTDSAASPRGIWNFMLKTGSNTFGIVSSPFNAYAAVARWFGSSDQPKPANHHNTKPAKTDQPKIVSDVFITCTHAATSDRSKAGDAFAQAYLRAASDRVQTMSAELGMQNADFYKANRDLISGNQFPVAVLTIPNPDDIAWKKGRDPKVTIHAVPANSYGPSDCGSNSYYAPMNIPRSKPTPP